MEIEEGRSEISSVDQTRAFRNGFWVDLEDEENLVKLETAGFEPTPLREQSRAKIRSND